MLYAWDPSPIGYTIARYYIFGWSSDLNQLDLAHGLDKDDGFDGVFLDGLIALSIKEFELFVVIFFENVFGEFVMERNFGLILVNFGLFHG